MRSMASRARAAIVGRHGDAMLHVISDVAHLGKRRHLHVRALRAVVGGEEVLVGILAAQPVQNADLRRHDELVRVGLRGPPDHPLGRQNRARRPRRLARPRSPRPRSSRSRTPDGSRNSAPGCSARCRRMCSGSMPACTWHSPIHTWMFVRPVEPAHVRAEEHVGEKENLLVGGNRVHDFDRIARRAAVVALGLHLGRRVDVRHDHGAGMLGLPRAQLLGVDRAASEQPAARSGSSTVLSATGSPRSRP